MALTFEQKINMANRSKSANFHIFAEFSDGKRDYYASRETEAQARALARQLSGALVYDRAGEEVPGFEDVFR